MSRVLSTLIASFFIFVLVGCTNRISKLESHRINPWSCDWEISANVEVVAGISKGHSYWWQMGTGQETVASGERNSISPTFRRDTLPFTESLVVDPGDSYTVTFCSDATALQCYDPPASVFCEPQTNYATYLGGNGDDGDTTEKIASTGRHGYLDMYVDKAGNVYLTGYASSTEKFPGVPQGTLNGESDLFVAKINVTGTLEFSMYLGGSGRDAGTGIVVDESGGGDIFLIGVTDVDGPNSEALLASLAKYPSFMQGFDPEFGGPFSRTVDVTGDAFVIKLDRDGQPMAGTYLGGDKPDIAYGIDLDKDGNVFVTGTMESDVLRDVAYKDFIDQTHVEHDPNRDLFVAKLHAVDLTLSSFTYLGVNGGVGHGIAIDTDQNVYVTGTLWKQSVWQPNCFENRQQEVKRYGALDEDSGNDVLIVKLDASLLRCRYATTLAGAGKSNSEGTDGGHAIAVDDKGNAYITGYTIGNPSTTKFPAHPLKGYEKTGGWHTFVTKLDPEGRIDYSDYYSIYLAADLSKYTDDLLDIVGIGKDIQVDDAGNAYVTGNARRGFPVTNGSAPCWERSKFDDIFVTVLDQTGSELLYSTCLGGGAFDGGYAIALDARGNIYVAGASLSADFIAGVKELFLLPAGTTLRQNINNGGTDVVVTKLLRTSIFP